MKRIKTPLQKKELKNLRVGEEVLLSGVIYTARDQAHKRLAQKGKKAPIELEGALIYYCGPNPKPKGKVIGSCGPTTSGRMDAFTPQLLKKGIAAMIGKGRRSAEVRRAIAKHRAVYFLTHAGCGALLSTYVKKARALAYKDLGPEAIHQLWVKDFPLIVAIDAKGRSIYAQK